MAKVFLIEVRKPQLQALLSQLASLWKSEHMRQLACVFEPDAPPVLEEACQALGLTTYRLDNHKARDILATLALKVIENGHEAILVSNDPALAQLLSHPHLSLLRSQGKTLETIDATRPHQLQSKKPLITDLPLNFSLESVTPGRFRRLPEFYRRVGLKRHLEPFENKLFEPSSVMELWS